MNKREMGLLEAQFVADNQCVQKFVDERRRRSAKTAKQYQLILHHYWMWLKEKKGFTNMQEVLDDFKAKKKEDKEYDHNDMVKEWLLTELVEKSLGYRNSCLACVRSWYSFNRCSLPQEKIDLRVKEIDRQRLRERMAKESKTMTTKDIRHLISAMRAREKAEMLILLQSGMGIDEFTTQFNVCTCRKEWLQRNGHICEPVKVMKQIAQGKELVKIDLMGRKSNPRPYFTYIGRDAIEMLRKYMDFRATLIREAQKKVEEYSRILSEGRYLEKKFKKALKNYKEKLRNLTPEWMPGQPLFISNYLNPVKAHNLQVPIQTYKRNMGLNNNGFSPHAFRDIFKTECSHAGVKKIISEYFIGHKLDKLGYNKLDEMYPEDFEKEYRKVEPALNIISHEGMIGREELKGLRQENVELRQRVDLLTSVVQRLVSELDKKEGVTFDDQVKMLMKERNAID